MRLTTCPDNAGLVRLAETDQADGQLARDGRVPEATEQLFNRR